MKPDYNDKFVFNEKPTDDPLWQLVNNWFPVYKAIAVAIAFVVSLAVGLGIGMAEVYTWRRWPHVGPFVVIITGSTMLGLIIGWCIIRWTEYQMNRKANKCNQS